MAELAARAGIPKGVLNVVTGSAKAIGGELSSNPAVRKLSFTGSTEVGRALMKQCADTIKKLSLELGGNAPFIVFDDADLDAAVEGAIASNTATPARPASARTASTYRTACTTRHRETHREGEGLKVGAGTEPGVVIDRSSTKRACARSKSTWPTRWRREQK